MDDALRRALNTPHKPHKDILPEGAEKVPRAKQKRVRAETPVMKWV
jgi:hypothetical protein